MEIIIYTLAGIVVLLLCGGITFWLVYSLDTLFKYFDKYDYVPRQRIIIALIPLIILFLIIAYFTGENLLKVISIK